MILIFIYTHDNIQKRVKEETALLGVRRNAQTKDGAVIPQFQALVMDEAYDTMFRRLFLEAHAELVNNIPAMYIQDTPTDLYPIYNEFPDFNKDRDFFLYINAGDDFAPQYKKSIDILMQRFLIDYICYRWFETKSGDDAATFFSRLEQTKKDILGMLNKRTGVFVRMPSFP